MTPQEFALKLTGREYGREITKAEEAEAKAAGLVVVFGYSDDNVELRGAINEEIGAYDGTTFRVGPEGLLPQWPADSDEGWSEDEAQDYFRRKAHGFREVEAQWSPDEPSCSWAYQTEIPHATFDVMEDGELYCRGIVFRLSDTARGIEREARVSAGPSPKGEEPGPQDAPKEGSAVAPADREALTRELDAVEALLGGANGPTIRLRAFIAAAAVPQEADRAALEAAVAFLEAFEAENLLHERESVGIETDDATYFEAASKTSLAAHAFRAALPAPQPTGGEHV